MKIQILFLATWLAPIECLVVANVANPTVSIASGVVVGTAKPVFSAPSSTATAFNYWGIPFAAPPTGSRRFNPPASPTAWKSALTATSLPPACIQQFSDPKSSADLEKLAFNNPGGPPPKESEDCLYLNVFAPTSASPNNLKSVLFWVFGGDLQFGTGSLAYYNGSSFAGFQDVVVVTHNYRTNIFGYPNSPELAPGLGNLGYLDQRAALQWVHDNIRAFGGDPEQITLFGQSAGGYSVKQLLANPPSPVPFRAAIMQSEAATYTGAGAVSYADTLAKFGCSSLDCLRNVSATDLQNFIVEEALAFPPVNDGITQSNDVRPNIASGKFVNVPVMMGTTADEGRVIAAAIGLDGANSTAQAFVQQLFPNNTAVQGAVLAAYSALQNDVYLFASAVLTDLDFTCTTSELSTLLSSSGRDVWRYYYNATFATESVFPDAGAYHASEIPQVFGTYQLKNQYGVATPVQVALSRYMQTAWANFAKDPFRGPGWVKLGANASGAGNQMDNLGGIDPEGGKLMTTSQVDHVCTVFDPIINVEGL